MGQRGTAIYFWPVLFFSASSRSAVQVPLPPPEGALFSTPEWKTNGQSEAASLWQGHPDILEVNKTHSESVYSLLQVQHVLKACIIFTKSGGSLPVWPGWSGECWYLMMPWGEWEKEETEAHREGVKGGQRRVKYHVIVCFKAADYWLRSGTRRRGSWKHSHTDLLSIYC